MSIEQVRTHAEWQRAVAAEGSDKVCVFDFGSDPREEVAPTYADIAAEHGGAARFYRVDIDEAEGLVWDNLVLSFPTFLFFRHGERIGQHVGSNTGKLREKLASLLP
jgi:thioredoxin 1